MMEIYIIDKYLGLSGPISGSDSSSPANKHAANVLLLLFRQLDANAADWMRK